LTVAIVADRGLFIRLLVQSGKFDATGAEALVDALDATLREPATKADLAEMREDLRAEIGEVRTELAVLSQRLDAQGARLDARIDAQGARLEAKIDALQDRLLVRLGGLALAISAASLAAAKLLFP
jgi:hypothetical protein